VIEKLTALLGLLISASVAATVPTLLPVAEFSSTLNEYPPDCTNAGVLSFTSFRVTTTTDVLDRAGVPWSVAVTVSVYDDCTSASTVAPADKTITPLTLSTVNSPLLDPSLLALPLLMLYTIVAAAVPDKSASVAAIVPTVVPAALFSVIEWLYDVLENAGALSFTSSTVTLSCDVEDRLGVPWSTTFTTIVYDATVSRSRLPATLTTPLVASTLNLPSWPDTSEYDTSALVVASASVADSVVTEVPMDEFSTTEAVYAVELNTGALSFTSTIVTTTF
jgi:hypothetical protein